MSIPLTSRAEQFAARTAIIAPEGTFTYNQLLEASARVASFLLDGAQDLEEKPVTFLVPPGFHYVAVQWGIWRAGGIAVPLSMFHPRPELEYVIDDTIAGGGHSFAGVGGSGPSHCRRAGPETRPHHRGPRLSGRQVARRPSFSPLHDPLYQRHHG